MRELARQGTIALLTAALLLVSSAAAAAQPTGEAEATAPEALVVPLAPVEDSGVRGHVRIAADQSEPRRAVLTIEAAGLQPGQAHPVRLRAGSPAQPSAGFGVVGELVADAAGLARLETTGMVASAAGAEVELTLDLLADGDHFLEVHAPGTAVVAVAEIPPA